MDLIIGNFSLDLTRYLVRDNKAWTVGIHGLEHRLFLAPMVAFSDTDSRLVPDWEKIVDANDVTDWSGTFWEHEMPPVRSTLLMVAEELALTLGTQA